MDAGGDHPPSSDDASIADDAKDAASEPKNVSWQNEDAAVFAGHDLVGIWGSAKDDVYVVGGGSVYRWSSGAGGLQWRVVHTDPQHSFSAIAGTGASDVWVAGANVSVGFDGSTWADRTPAPGSVTRMTAVGQGDYWAAPGLRHFQSGAWTNADATTTDVTTDGANVFALHMIGVPESSYGYDVSVLSNGETVATLPAFASQSASAYRRAWASGPKDIFIAGSDGIAHSNGGNFTQQITEPVSGIWGFSPTDVFAVGAQKVLHYDGTNWTSETLPPGDHDLVEVWCASPDDIWAIGKRGALVHRVAK